MRLEDICDALAQLKLLVLRNGCFKIEQSESELAEFCCLSGLAYPLDGFEKIMITLDPNTNHEIFDNEFEINSPNYLKKLITRGVVLYFKYAETDINGEDVEDDDMNIGIKLTDTAGNEFTVPVYNFYSVLNNPTTSNNNFIINKMEIINNNDFEVTVSGLIIMGDRDGVSLSSSSSANC